MTDEQIRIEVGSVPTEKRGFFMGWYAHDKSNPFLDVWEYASYRDADVIKSLAPEFIAKAYGPMFVMVHTDEYERTLGFVDAMKFGEALEVYTNEYPGHGAVFFSNHIPVIDDVKYEMIADHSECTPGHCKDDEAGNVDASE